MFIPNGCDVFEYLRDFPDMISVVYDICYDFECRLKDKAELTLEVYYGVEPGYRYLTLYIRQHDYREDIMGFIESVISNYDDRLADVKGWLVVTTDFQKPKYE